MLATRHPASSPITGSTSQGSFRSTQSVVAVTEHWTFVGSSDRRQRPARNFSVADTVRTLREEIIKDFDSVYRAKRVHTGASWVSTLRTPRRPTSGAELHIGSVPRTGSSLDLLWLFTHNVLFTTMRIILHATSPTR